MKATENLSIKVIIFILAAVIQNTLYAQPGKADEFEVMMNQWKEAYNSGDAKNLIPLYTEDAIYTSSHVAGLAADGREKLVANFQNGINMGGHIDFIEILKKEVSAEIVSLYCKYQATNAGVTVTGRNLLVLKKQNSKWKISLHMTVV